MLKTTLSPETMLAERNCAFSSAGSFQDAFSTSAYQASKCFFTPVLNWLFTRLFTNPLRVVLAMIRTSQRIPCSQFGSKKCPFGPCSRLPRKLTPYFRDGSICGFKLTYHRIGGDWPAFLIRQLNSGAVSHPFPQKARKRMGHGCSILLP